MMARPVHRSYIAGIVADPDTCQTDVTMVDWKAHDRCRRPVAVMVLWHLVGILLIPLAHLALASPAHSAHDCPICTSLQQPREEFAGESAAAFDPALVAGGWIAPAPDAFPSAAPVFEAPARSPPAV
jgi:hypothetical protein